MSKSDEIRDQQRQTWDKFSAGWTKWDELVLKMLEPVGVEMIRSLELQGDEQHLDIAAGTGEPGLSIAALLPQGRVVLTDLSAGMLETAGANAKAQGLKNVEVRECSVEALPFEDASFDTISCRFGFMFFPDIPAAVSELQRVLRPSGRISTAVWAEPPGNPWATIPMAAISSEVELPAPAPDAPGLFRCAAPGAIAGVFRDAGMHDVVESEVRTNLDASSAEEYWSFMTEVAAPVVAGLASADDAARERIRAATIEQVRTFEVDGKPSIPLHARCIAATKSSAILTSDKT
ncbi:MAG: methyltransferase domain-containing protein [Acidimicrobiia bacterium]|nr:methyltransferase domain-containing protein [Acidimicrobiia bacterium]